MQAADVGPGLDRRLSRRRQLHAAALRSEYRSEQQRLLRIQGVRQTLRAGEGVAKLGGTQSAFSADVATDGSRYGVEPQRIAAAQRADQAVGPRIQKAPDSSRRVCLRRRKTALTA